VSIIENYYTLVQLWQSTTNRLWNISAGFCVYRAVVAVTRLVFPCALLVAVAAIAGASRAQAKCGSPQSVEDAVGRAGAVFEATVIARDEKAVIGVYGIEHLRGFWYTAVVHRVWKGNVGPTTRVFGADHGCVGAWFLIGHTYLMYGGSADRPDVSRCHNFPNWANLPVTDAGVKRQLAALGAPLLEHAVSRSLVTPNASTVAVAVVSPAGRGARGDGLFTGAGAGFLLGSAVAALILARALSRRPCSKCRTHCWQVPRSIR
jgi:hypothetical protein